MLPMLRNIHLYIVQNHSGETILVFMNIILKELLNINFIAHSNAEI